MGDRAGACVLVPEPGAVTPETEDSLAYAQDLQRERCVLFVACTRARDHLHVSGTGEPSPFLPPGAVEPAPPHRGEINALSCSTTFELGRPTDPRHGVIEIAKGSFLF